MTIDFSPLQWQKVRKNYADWWDGHLERPLVPACLWGRDPGRACPPAPLLTQETCADLRWSAEELVDRIDYELSRQVYLGDAFPLFRMECFGPGVAAAFLGARLDNSSGWVWFFPQEHHEIHELHFEFNPDNAWFQRVKSIYEAAMRRWNGSVLMGMTDLGGTVDILSTFLPAEQLLFELVDHPQEVERLTWELHECWFQIYEALDAVLQPVNPGYSDWSELYSAQPSYMLQCDFSYMIGPSMFKRFILPELSASCRRLERAFYHLDGVGQIPHLPMLLDIAELDGVQWVPGDGKPDCANWPELYRAIQAAGKKIQVVNGGVEALHAIRRQTGSLKGVHSLKLHAPLSERAQMEDQLAALGVI